MSQTLIFAIKFLSPRQSGAHGTCHACHTLDTPLPMIPRSIPTNLFEKVAMDIMTRCGQDYLVVVVYYSRYPEFRKTFDGAGCLYFFGQKRTPIVLLQLKVVSCSAASSPQIFRNEIMNVKSWIVLTPVLLNDAYMRHTFKYTGCGTTYSLYASFS